MLQKHEQTIQLQQPGWGVPAVPDCAFIALGQLLQHARRRSQGRRLELVSEEQDSGVGKGVEALLEESESHAGGDLDAGDS